MPDAHEYMPEMYKSRILYITFTGAFRSLVAIEGFWVMSNVEERFFIDGIF
ncbi:hypothetical protein Hanom_Chr11g00972191 [Helianthus anomalus]